MNTLLIVGFGDIAKRVVPLLDTGFDTVALVRARPDVESGAFPNVRFEPGDLDVAESLPRFAGRASHLLHCAPPPVGGALDPRTRNLLAALATRAPRPRRIVYISTSGVYGDCGGDIVDETRPPRPQSERARRRLDAEERLIDYGARHGASIVILRAPGIYASDRLPLKRLRDKTPVLRAEDDVYTNHIHADDLASMVAAAVTHAEADGVYNACDDSELKMGDWFDLLADRSGLPRPPRIPRTQAHGVIPAPLLSFMSESRRLCNARIKSQLGVQLRYPTVRDGVPQIIK